MRFEGTLYEEYHARDVTNGGAISRTNGSKLSWRLGSLKSSSIGTLLFRFIVSF